MYLAKTIIFACFLLLFYPSSCKKNDPPTKPPFATPDTTSHDFTWQIDFLGDGNASRLNDVCIVDENNVWAVGRICVKDSIGEFINPPFNLAHWNGDKWELMSIKFQYYYGLIYTDAKCIYAFDPENIVISSGGSVMHWDGNSWKGFPYLFNLSSSIGNIYSIWGNSIDDFYGVGLEGSIVHYNGSSWQKIESGTNQPINDIWGSYNQKTQDYKIFCVASDKYHGGEKKVFQIINNETVEFDWSPQRAAHSVWFQQDTPLFVCGSGLFMYDTNHWSQIESLPNIFKNRIRGNHQYDIFIAGDFGLMVHYNGNSWYIYEDLTLPNGNYESLIIKGDLVIAVGWQEDKAVICRGIRKN